MPAVESAAALAYKLQLVRTTSVHKVGVGQSLVVWMCHSLVGRVAVCFDARVLVQHMQQRSKSLGLGA